MPERVSALTREIADRTQLSTTGYQTAMGRMNNSHKLDGDALMTMRRAEQYVNAAKRTYPTETLKSLASLQQSYIYKTSDGELRGAIEMSSQQISKCIDRCRENGFSNCDVQALEVALHLKYRLGLDNFKIVSNNKLSHNYVVIEPCKDFPRGAIADSWTGQGLLELNLKTKLKFKHQEQNFQINKNMHKWIEEYGRGYVLPE
ncbi:type III effector (plasmid) [Pantoea stewartii subsp. stewartii DC283]|uniref:Type III effector n=1 Tax=Pantoea stewartii subsp. stewartii DC283 TaxID=660596 RepID=A0ABN4ZCR4_PANSE|nr:type III effector [Pantoea stewartii subsp. stewartii DC283]KAB0545672.1 type III effector [Pantoea stewartii subsp. stewartii]